MKTLYLLRHAAAEKQAGGQLDQERSLTKKGRKDAKKLARFLREKGVKADLIISSPAVRALQTAKIYARALDYSAKRVAQDGAIYEGGDHPEENLLLNLVQKFDDQHEAVLVVGHDPLISQFASYLQPSFRESFLPGAIVALSFRNKTWGGIAPGKGKVDFYEFPGRLAKLWKEMEQNLSGEIEAQLGAITDKFNPLVGEQMRSSLRKSGKKLARKFVKIYRSLDDASKLLVEQAATAGKQPAKAAAEAAPKPRGRRKSAPAPEKTPSRQKSRKSGTTTTAAKPAPETPAKTADQPAKPPAKKSRSRKPATTNPENKTGAKSKDK